MIPILDKIKANKLLEVEELKIERPLNVLMKQMPGSSGGAFRNALSDDCAVNIIAELKKGSPSKGILLPDFDPEVLARQYRDGGAAALSVLTERKYFLGRPEYIESVRRVSGLPVLCKDFIIDPYQLYYAKVIQADAVLLIVRLHTVESLKEYLNVASEIELDCLVEVHNERELEIALEAGADIVGVNNRNLEDFSITLETSEILGALIPEHVIRVAESGISDPGDIKRLRKSGFNNFLVGEALVKASDRAGLIQALKTG